MNLRIFRIREQLATSLWFIPLVSATLSLILAETALQIDEQFELDNRRSWWFLFAGDGESARSLLSTVAASMLTFTGLVFTVTMLVLQLASNQLSPRVMRTFLRDNLSKSVLGVFIATFLYAILVLRRVDTAADGDFVPILSVWITLVLVLASLILFILYVDHIAQSVRPTSVMDRVVEETRSAIARLYPDRIGDGRDEGELPEMARPPDHVVEYTGGEGVLIAVDVGQLDRIPAETIARLRVQPGDYIRRGAPVFSVWGELSDEQRAGLQSAISTGPERTTPQDAAFGLRQLVDIAVRALSPGVNDPTTAVQVVDRLHGLLATLVDRDYPQTRRRLDGGGGAILPRPGWNDYLALACDEIRDHGKDSLQVTRRMRHMLLDLRSIAPPARIGPLEAQLARLDAQLDQFSQYDRSSAATPSAQGHPVASGEQR